MIKDKKNLYRTGYFESQKMDGEGRILLKVSFNQNVYLCLSVILLLLVIIFVSFSEYTRRETLVGIVSPLGGTVKVRAIRIARNNEKPITKLISGELVTKIEHEGEDIIACQMPPYLTNAAN
ncbi:MAG: hypothetical protein ACK5MF_01140 [Vibrio sp.]|uniref:hypothetical protein n=1 Tax=Vibrio sp. TaxID=678 RepID=UPI003A86E9BB